MQFSRIIKLIILAVLLITIFFIFRNYLSYSFIFADDTETLRLYHNLWSVIFKEPSNGIYISSSLDRIFGANLPYLLNIHPSFFKSEYFSSIEAVFLIFFIIIFSLFLKRLNYICVFLFSSSLLLYIVQKQCFVLFVYDGFFRMLLPAVMFVALFLMMLQNEKKLSVLILPIFTFLCAISNEMICVTSAVGLVLYSIVCILKKYCPRKFRDKPNEMRCERNFGVVTLKSEHFAGGVDTAAECETGLDKNRYLYLICALSAIAGIIVLYKTGAFFRKAPMGTYNNYEYLLKELKQIKDFIPVYFKYIFLNHIFAYILLILQGIFLHFKLRNYEYKNNILSLIICFIAGMLTFFAALIFLGKTHYYQGQYWIIHNDLHMIYSIILSVFNMSLSELIIKNKLINRNFVNCILIIAALILMNKNYNFYPNIVKNEINYLRLETYKAEKIIRLANSLNKTAYIDEVCLEHAYLWGLRKSVKEAEKNKYYNYSPYVRYLNQFKISKKINNNWMFTEKEKVEKEFIENGGKLEELQKPDFKL